MSFVATPEPPADGPAQPADDPAAIVDILAGLRDPADPEAAGPPLWAPAAAMAAAVLGRDGGLVTADPTLLDWFDPAAVAAAASGDGPRLRPLTSRDGQATCILVAPASEAATWPLSRAVRATEGRQVVLAYRPFAVEELVRRACDGCRLTSLEARTVSALLAADNLRGAAGRAGVGYETAREAIASALRKAGARRQTDLVRRLHAALGASDAEYAEAPVLAEALGLTPRAAEVCRLLAQGLTRPEIAGVLHRSEHVVKAELKRLYEVLGVSAAVPLSLLVTEATTLLALAQARNVTLAERPWELRPLRFLHRPDGAGRIALSDFGPASGAPVILMHSALTGALIDRGLIRALQARGLRPIAVERPGFGLTDPPVDGLHPGRAAAEDLVAVVDGLKLKRVRLVCRGGEDAALRFAAERPDLFAGGVLINPFRPWAADTRRDGLMNVSKRAIYSEVGLIEKVGAALVRMATPGTLARLTREALKSSPADQAALADPAVISDYVDCARLAALATPWGFMAEQRAYATWRPQALADGSGWVRLLGLQDSLYRAGDAEEIWRAALPGHRVIERADAGRMLHASHPDLVAEVVAGLG